MSESDFLDEKGDRWVVRGCDAEDGCIVVERFMLRNPPQGLDKLVDDFAREATGQPPRATEEVPDDEADDDIHIPAGVVQAIAAALASSKPSAAFVAMRTALESIMDSVACTQMFMLDGRDVLLDATSVQVNSEYLIKARAALALAEKEAGTTPPTT